MTKWTTYLAGVLVALVFAIPAGGQVNGEYAHVLGERAQAGAAQVQHVERARARGEMESALTKRGQALNGLTAVDASVAAADDGFDWAAAGGGAGAMFALVLTATGVVFLVRRKSVTDPV
jgi:hypothetical protein